MISQRAWNALTMEIQRRNLEDGILSAALFLYLKNFSDTKAANPTFSDKKVEDLCLFPTSVDSVVEAARRTFVAWSDSHQLKNDSKAMFGSALWNVGLGILSNALFVCLSLLFIAAFKDQAKNFLQALGF